jgi:hypothetical protein
VAKGIDAGKDAEKDFAMTDQRIQRHYLLINQNLIYVAYYVQTVEAAQN